MPKKNSNEEVFKMLINKQLEPHNKTFEDVQGEEEWYLKYTTTEEKEKEFKDWGTDLVRKKLRLSKKRAEKEMSWFLLGYGLKMEK